MQMLSFVTAPLSHNLNFKMTHTFFEQFKASVAEKNFDNIYILTHGNPDGDAVGSSFALAHLLRHFGKRTAVFFSEKNMPNRKFSYIEDLKNLSYDFLPEHIVTADLTDMNRVSGIPECFADKDELESKIDFVIDHHEVNILKCNKKLVLPEKGACAEIIYDLYKYLEVPFDEFSAAAIYTAVLTDTGAFRYSNTTPSALLCAAELMPYISAALRSKIIGLNFETKPKAKAIVESEAIREAIFAENDTLAFAVFDKERRERLNATDDTLDGVSSVLRQIEGVKASFMLRFEPDGRYKISARSNYDGETGIDVSAICEVFGGGGHKAASGCTATGSPDEIIKRITEECRKYGK